MAKEILLSFNYKYFKPLFYGLKKYEYRKRFCDEETTAYLYLSGKTRKVIGILELGKPIKLNEIRNNYLENPEILQRINEYIKDKSLNAVPITSLSLYEKPITLEDIRKELPEFMPPQMYYVLNNNKKLLDILKKSKVTKPLFIHKHQEIYEDNIAVSSSKLVSSDEMQFLEKNISKNNLYEEIIK